MPLLNLIAAFELKIHASLALLEAETAELSQTPFGIGHLTLVCALGYIDYRFADHEWRGRSPRLAAWFETMQQRPSVQATKPVDG